MLLSRSGFSREHQLIVFIHIWFRLMATYFSVFCTSLCSTLRALRVLICSRQISQQRQKSMQKNAVPGARASHALSHLPCQRVVLTRIPARQDSIDHPWSIDPVARMKRSVIRVVSRWEHPRITRCSIRATLNDGRNILPVKFAEPFGFGRAKK